MAAEQPSILFRCDGAEDIGLGHVVRCLALADELKDAHNCRVVFAIHRDKPGINLIKEKGYPVITIDNNPSYFTEEKFLKKAVAKSRCKVIIMDFRTPISLDFLNLLKQQGILLVDIDDPNEKRLLADLAFYPPVPHVKIMNWSGLKGQLMVGWEWVILRREFTTMAVQPRFTNSRRHLLVTMGGSDPAGFTLTAIKALDLIEDDFDTTVVLGRAFSREKDFQSLLLTTKRKFRILRDIKNMAAIMAQTDLAIASFGMTAYELAFMGVPALFFCLTDDHADSCQAFVDEHIAISLCGNEIKSIKDLAKVIQPLLNNKENLYKMSANARSIMTVNGTRNIASRILESMKG